MLRRALNGMAESHPTESFELLTKHPEIAGEGLYRDIFARWGQGRASPEAMAAINGLTSHTWRREAIGGLAESLGERDLEAALKWAKDLGNPAERDGQSDRDEVRTLLELLSRALEDDSVMLAGLPSMAEVGHLLLARAG